MRLQNKRTTAIVGCFVLALVFLAPHMTRGDDWNLATRFTINQPFEVPNLVLQPNTRYVIRLLDSPSNRNVVQIYNEDQTKLLTMFMAISDQRTEATDKTVFTFIETQPGYPVPMKEWFYPGRLIGQEFIYPKSQALEIARHSREPILATDGDIHDVAALNVETVRPLGETTTVTKAEPAPITEEKPSITEQPEEQPAIAENTESNLKTEPEVQREKPAETPAAAAPVTEENRELPKTAGELPLIGLIGVLCLGAGLGLKVLRARG